MTYFPTRKSAAICSEPYRVLPPTVNHLHKVLSEKDGEIFSLLRETIKTELILNIWNCDKLLLMR